MSTHDYNVFVVEPAFLDGASFNITSSPTRIGYPYLDPAIIQADIGIPGRYERLNNSDCINAYAVDLSSHRRNVVLVSSNSTQSEYSPNSSVLHIEYYSYKYSIAESYQPYGW